MAEKTDNVTDKIIDKSIQQLDLIAEQIKLKSYLFKDNNDSEDEDSEDEDSEDEDSENEDTEKDHNIFLQDMNCCFVLYLGSMSSNKSLDTPNMNCLYSQVRKQSENFKNQGKELEFINILFIGPHADKKNHEEIIKNIKKITKNNCFTTIDYIINSFPTIEKSQTVEQLFLLKHLFFDKKKAPRMQNLTTNSHFNVSSVSETKNEFIFHSQGREIFFKKPTIPVIQSEFFNLLKKIIAYFIDTEISSKVIVVNGFWFETINSLQDNSSDFIVTNMPSDFISNILFGMIPYFIPFISEMKKKYNDKFVVVNQYFYQIPKFMCLDVAPHILSANAEVTTNGNLFLIDDNSSEAKIGGKRKTRRKTKKKK